MQTSISDAQVTTFLKLYGSARGRKALHGIINIKYFLVTPLRMNTTLLHRHIIIIKQRSNYYVKYSTAC